VRTWLSPEEYVESRRCVVSVGNFDGVHRGHAGLVSGMVRYARERGLAAVVVTFAPHTRTALHPSQPLLVLSTLEEKAVLLGRFGVDHLVRLAFDSRVRQLTAERFVAEVVARRLRASAWVMGHGHRFGSDHLAPGPALHELLGRNDITLLPLELLADDGDVVSSTSIRTCVGSGDMERAVAMLGHPYLIAARRVVGRGIGTGLGFPTLNFECPPAEKVLPPPGVYAARLQVGSQALPGALYFGTCATLGAREAHFEMHLLGDAGAAPSTGEVGLLWVDRHVRGDQVLSDGAELTRQIRRDVTFIQGLYREGAVACL